MVIKMKKIVVMSDNHGESNIIDEIREREYDADVFVHCGDSEANSELLHGWIGVKGNNDWSSTLNEEEIIRVDGIGIYICHGHRLPFFDRTDFVTDLLRRNDCQILLCGHTHVPEHTMIDEFHIINPGSTTLPRRGSDKGYCVIKIQDKNIKVEFKKI